MEIRLFAHHVQHSLHLLPLPRRLCFAVFMLSDSMVEVKAAKQTFPASEYTYFVLVYLLPPQHV